MSTKLNYLKSRLEVVKREHLGTWLLKNPAPTIDEKELNAEVSRGEFEVINKSGILSFFLRAAGQESRSRRWCYVEVDDCIAPPCYVKFSAAKREHKKALQALEAKLDALIQKYLDAVILQDIKADVALASFRDYSFKP